MNRDYYLTIKASAKFWEQLISKSVNKQSLVGLIDNEAELTFISTNPLDIQKIKMLSEFYPDEVFNVSDSLHDFCCDILQEYEIKNGRILHIYNKPAFIIEISNEVMNKVDPIIIIDFKKEIAEFMNRIRIPATNYLKNNLLSRLKESIISNVELRYSRNQYVLSAKLIGMTYIKIELVSCDSDDEVPFKKLSNSK